MRRSPHDDYVRSLRHARSARRRGDPAAADHWTRIAERHLRMATRLSALKAPFHKPLWTPSVTEEQQKADIVARMEELLRQPGGPFGSGEGPSTPEA